MAAGEDNSIALPFTPRPAALDGELVGDVGFDPLGFSEGVCSLFVACMVLSAIPYAIPYISLLYAVGQSDRCLSMCDPSLVRCVALMSLASWSSPPFTHALLSITLNAQ